MSFTRRSVVAASLVLCAAMSAPIAFAQDRPRFNAKAFEQAKAQGKPIFIEVFAPWCPTCRRQQPIITSLLKRPEFAGVQAFTVDFDNQKDALKALRVTGQSTLVVFKGAKETGRAVGVTDAAEIENLMRKSL
jgi:thiol-disulfide isomerase/thioredoxin